MCLIGVISFALFDLSFLYRVMKSIDDILDLSQTFGLQTSDAGTIVVGFIFSTVWQLIDASLDDEGLLEHDDPEKKSRWVIKPQEMEIDGYEKGNEHYERLQNQNTVMAIELITQFLQNKLTSKILNLAKQNMYTSLFELMDCVVIVSYSKSERT